MCISLENHFATSIRSQFWYNFIHSIHADEHTDRHPTSRNHFTLKSVKAVLQACANQYLADEHRPFQDVLVIAVQHMLATTVDMFAVMKSLGLKDAIVTGKLYSDHAPSIDALSSLGITYIANQQPNAYGRFQESFTKTLQTVWQSAEQKLNHRRYKLIILLDDGADLLLNIPAEVLQRAAAGEFAIAGIEQTRGGSNRQAFHGIPVPLVNVAGSTVKNLIEYDHIATQSWLAVKHLIRGQISTALGRSPAIGIIGFGALGKALARLIAQQSKQKISVYDNQQLCSEHSQIIMQPHLASLIANSDVIFSCTGQDVTLAKDVFDMLNHSRSAKWLVSTSSKDIEFNALLTAIQSQHKQLYTLPELFAHIGFRNRNGVNITCLKGGFPVNFRNTAHCVPPEHIWPTRAALLMSCLMLTKYYEEMSSGSVYQLDAHAQAIIFRQYSNLNPLHHLAAKFNSLTTSALLDLITSSSEGMPLHQTKDKAIHILPTEICSLPGHYYTKDLQGHYLSCNQAFLASAEVATADAIVGQTDAQLWSSSAAKLSSIDTQVMGSKKMITVIEHVKIKNRSLKQYLSVKAPLLDESGKVIGIQGNSIELLPSVTDSIAKLIPAVF